MGGTRDWLVHLESDLERIVIFNVHSLNFAKRVASLLSLSPRSAVKALRALVFIVRHSHMSQNRQFRIPSNDPLNRHI